MAKRLEDYIIAAGETSGNRQRSGKLGRKRSGMELTREQVRAIKAGRKLLRAEMKARGLKGKEDFELTASSMGLYFDKGPLVGIIPWLFGGRGLLVLLGALALLMAGLWLYSSVVELQGHFTINLTDDMFKEGFVLSETPDFDNATTHLFAQPAEDIPCISILHVPENVDKIDGQHNDDYMAYTFYIRNEGESTVDFQWELGLNSESKNVSSACWVMIFEDGKMKFYAEPNAETGEAEALPAFDDNTRGYIEVPPALKYLKRSAEQLELMVQGRNYDYYRVIPYSFESKDVVARGEMLSVDPMETHKYTIVIWLEGDDPDCTDDLIGGHVGMEMRFQLVMEEAESGENQQTILPNT